MYIKNGIAYAGEATPVLKVIDVTAVKAYILLLTFNNGEVRLFDCAPLLSKPAFAPLTDFEVFKTVKLDHSVPVWNDGEIDVDPELLYDQSIPSEGVSA